MFERTKISLVFWVLVFGVASWALGHFHVADSTGKMVTITEGYSYYYDILIGIGIAMVLATSLNLVNGHTGQFSLGHAGFMGLGA